MDILLGWNPALAFADWSIAGGGIAASQTGSDDLKTAVLVSLFSDRVVPSDYVFTSSDTDPRGWWGDSYEPSLIGSRLWTLNRAKNTDASLLRLAKTYCVEALQWLLDDGIATKIDVSTSWLSASALGIATSITKPGGAVFAYSWSWQGF